ncbi:hypothetical protein Tco_0977984 [Tanacetum coccineum]|uniref:Uncharacterized protein n=1 Tax=Tanacetum coccineum TaxID=301880 RepID=A0ABQ5ELV1_9ASTR
MISMMLRLAFPPWRVDDTQGRSNNEEMFDINDLYSDEVNVDMPVGEKQEQSAKEREVDTNVKYSDALITIEEITLAQTLIQIKLAKPKVVNTGATTTTTTRPKAIGVVLQEPKEERITRKKEEETNIALIESSDNTQAMMEADFKKKHFAMLRAEEKRRKPPNKAQKRNLMSTYLKNMGGYRHNQLKSKSYEEIQKLFNNEMRRAELIEEERIAKKKEEEANITLIGSCDNTQAMMEADFKLAQKLQTKEQAEITIEERSRLFVELMNKRKKHFAMLRAEKKKRKPPTKAQKRNLMSTYLKSMVKSKKETKESSKGIEDELKSDKSKKEESGEEKAKGSRKKILGKKRAGKEQQQESSKRQRMEDDKEIDEHEEVEVDDEAELKKHFVIVKDNDIAINAIPLTTKPPVIVEYELLKEGIMAHYQLIRAD